MGKQKGQSNRTKGNARPSSSIAAANAFDGTRGVVGFASFSGDLGYIPVLKSVEDDSEGSIDPDFRVPLCKLSKRDVTTKLKALAELIELSQNNDSDKSVSMLPNWPRIYNRLSEDSDRRVREGLQQTHHAIVTKVGKEIAPFLKGLFGAWWIATCDAYAPVASAAWNAFSAAFPTPAKQGKVLVFCHQEILHAVKSNVFMAAVQGQKEDEENDMERILASSLSALAAFITTLESVNCMDKLGTENFTDFLTKPRFWKLARHKAPGVGSAFFSVITSFLSGSNALLGDYLSQVCKAVLSRLNDSSSLACRAQWDATEKLMISFPNWHEHIDLRKVFLPSFWSVIKSGFNGNAKIICPHLLPMVGCFPASLFAIPVYQELFNCLQIALDSNTVQSSASETRAVITATVECAQLILQKSVEVCDDPNWEAIDLILKGQLLPIFEKSIQYPDSNKYLTAPLHQLVVGTLSTLSYKANDETKQQKSYIRICCMIWKEITRIATELLNQCKTRTNSLQCMINFLFAVKLASCGSKPFQIQASVKSKPGVRFRDEAGINSKETDKAPSSKVTNVYLFQSLEICLRDVVGHILQSQFNPGQRLSFASLVLEKFATSTLFDQVFHLLADIVPSGSDHDLSYECLRQYFLPCVKDIVSSNPETQHHSATLLYTCLKCCGSDAETIAQEIFSDPEIHGGVQCCMLLAVHFLTNDDNPTWLRNWLSSETGNFSKFLLDIVESDAHLKLEESWKLLNMSMTGDKAVLQSKSALDILKKLYETVETTEKSNFTVTEKASLLTTASIISYISDSGFVTAADVLLGLMFEKLFRSVLYNQHETSFDIFVQLLQMLDSSRHLNDDLLQLSNNYFIRCADTVCKEILEKKETAEDNLPANIEKVLDFLSATISHHGPEVINNFYSHLLPSESTWLQHRSDMSRKSWLPIEDVIEGRVISSTFEKTKMDSNYVNLVRVMKQLCFESLLVDSQQLSSNKYIELLDCYKESAEWCKYMLSILAQKSSQVGGGWICCFSKFLSKIDFSCNWKQITLLNDIDYANQTMNEAFCSTLISVVNSCDMLSAKKLFDWIVPKTLSFSGTFDTILDGGYVYEFTALVNIFRRLLFLENYENVLADTSEQIIEQLLLCKSSFSSVFLFDVAFNNNSFQLLFNSSVARFIKLAVECKPSGRSSEFWEFAQCSLVSWLESACMTFEGKEFISEPQFHNQLALLHSAASLLSALDKYLTDPATIEDPTLPTSLTREWHEFFQPAAHSTLVTIFLHLSKEVSLSSPAVYSLIQNCLWNIHPDSITSCSSRLPVYLTPDSQLSDKMQTLLHHLCLALEPNGKTYTTQAITYTLLSKISGKVFLKENGDLLTAESIRQPIKLVRSLSQNPDSDLENPLLPEMYQSNTFAYLLMWKVLLHLICNVPADAKSDFLSKLEENGLSISESLLPKLLQLMPLNPHRKDDAQVINMFQSEVDFRTSSGENVAVVQHLACSLFKEVLTNLPVLIRSWYNGLGKVVRGQVDDYTTKHISGMISNEELKSVSVSKDEKDLHVSARTASREILATYQIVDAEFEISIQLPPNYPLSPAQVNTVRRVGVGAAQWRYWILQMTMLLQHQNGRILDALSLWKNKVDKRLDGLEECMICFSVVHGSNAQSLPKLQCRTCRKKYHAECLYKWFDTSNQSTCPLCRAPMM
uniref:E3 ubiquitin-protein ligase listerin n=1 Tax=Ciona savignyi TaxID=51511 RepID=H2YUW7_CIOSA